MEPNIALDNLSENADALIAQLSHKMAMGSGAPADDFADDLIPGTSPHYMPRYQIPSISSILPEYSNSEQEYIKNAFAQGSYNSINGLPPHLKVHEVNRMRSALMEAVRKPLPGSALKNSVTGATGLFREYEYVPSQYNMEEMLLEQNRLEAHAARMAVCDQEWRNTGNFDKGKHEEGFVENSYYPYSSDPYHAAKDMVLRHLWMEEQKILNGPWKPAIGEKVLAEPPGPTMRADIVKSLYNIITEDWEDVEVNIYENSDGHWVIRFKLDSVDSETGLLTYMNVMIRTNTLVTLYCMTKVTEHWNIKPGDGFVYFTLRPAWVKKTLAEDLYHPTASQLKNLEKMKGKH